VQRLHFRSIQSESLISSRFRLWFHLYSRWWLLLPARCLPCIDSGLPYLLFFRVLRSFRLLSYGWPRMIVPSLHRHCSLEPCTVQSKEAVLLSLIVTSYVCVRVTYFLTFAFFVFSSRL